MSVLHHVAMPPARTDAWARLRATLAPGDVVVLLDQAARQAAESACLAQGCTEAGLRWCIPAVEQIAAPLPAPLVVIADEDWWQLIASHARVIEWS